MIRENKILPGQRYGEDLTIISTSSESMGGGLFLPITKLFDFFLRQFRCQNDSLQVNVERKQSLRNQEFAFFQSFASSINSVLL